MDLQEDLINILEFYKVLGIESIPMQSPVHPPSKETVNNNKKWHGATTSDEKKKALETLRQYIGDCYRCKLAQGRKNIVFGEGNVNAKIMFIGEAPGRDEDIQGRPFVGQAGQILTSLINKMGKEQGFNFQREDVFIANIVKCRPPENRDPQPDEIDACIGFLNKQIEIIAPQIIISLGRISTHTLMRLKIPLNKFSISDARGKFFEYETDHMIIPVMPTFHPAYFLRNPKDKHLTWSDALAVLERLRRTE